MGFKKSQHKSTNNINCKQDHCSNLCLSKCTSPYKYKNANLKTCLKWNFDQFYGDRNELENLKRPLAFEDYNKDLLLQTCCEIL